MSTLPRLRENSKILSSRCAGPSGALSVPESEPTVSGDAEEVSVLLPCCSSLIVSTSAFSHILAKPKRTIRNIPIIKKKITRRVRHRPFLSYSIAFLDLRSSTCQAENMLNSLMMHTQIMQNIRQSQPRPRMTSVNFTGLGAILLMNRRLPPKKLLATVTAVL